MLLFGDDLHPHTFFVCLLLTTMLFVLAMNVMGEQLSPKKTINADEVPKIVRALVSQTTPQAGPNARAALIVSTQKQYDIEFDKIFKYAKENIGEDNVSLIAIDASTPANVLSDFIDEALESKTDTNVRFIIVTGYNDNWPSVARLLQFFDNQTLVLTSKNNMRVPARGVSFLFIDKGLSADVRTCCATNVQAYFKAKGWAANMQGRLAWNWRLCDAACS